MAILSTAQKPLVSHLTKDSTKDEQSADAAVIESLAGRTRSLYEMVGGTVAEAGGAPMLNPQGVVGADFSGPPFGSAKMHLVACYAGTSDANSSGGRSFDPSSPVYFNDLRVFIRPHISYDGAPYTRLYPAIIASSTSSNTITMDYLVNNDLDYGGTLSFGSVASSTPGLFALSGSNYIPVPRGGGWIRLRLIFDATGAGTPTVTSVSLLQRAKRSH